MPLSCEYSNTVPHITPTSTPLLPPPNSPPEIVVFVGYPAMGKTTFYSTHFQPAEYIHINQDTLRTREKCIKAAEETLKEGKSCVIGSCAPILFALIVPDSGVYSVDNTNRDKTTRKYYVDLAKKYKAGIRYETLHSCPYPAY